MVVEYGCVVGSWDKFHTYVAPRTAGRRVHTRFGATSICAAYNSILDSCGDVDALILLHDDLELTDPDAEQKLLAAFTDDVALVGVCGGKGDRTLAWWESDRVGHQLTDSGLLDFGPRSGDVAFIEGSIMAFTPWAVENLRFDTRYPGFLGYDDICLTAREMGKRVVVVDVDTHHHSTVGLKSPEVAAAWTVAETIFQEKWWGTR